MSSITIVCQMETDPIPLQPPVATVALTQTTISAATSSSVAPVVGEPTLQTQVARLQQQVSMLQHSGAELWVTVVR